MRAPGAPWLVIVSAAIALGSERPVLPDVSDWRPSIVALASPAGAGSAQPQMTVSPRGILLSWIEQTDGRSALRFAERTAAGWSPPQTAAAGGNWFVNWADVPSVLRLDGGTLAAHWLQKSGPETYAYDVRLAYSTDEGRTWSRSFTPHDDGLRREHGFASLFQMPGAGLGLVWLDGRAMASADGHGSHGGADGAMSLRFGSFDQAWKQTRDVPVDLRVCECCPTTAAMTSEGPIVAYRDRSDAEVRDIYVSRLVDGTWTEPKAVHEDRWTIAACPVNGPMLSARGRDVVLAWFTVVKDAGQAFAAFSSDAGRTFGSPVRLDERAALGRVDVVLLPDGSAVATWIEFADQQTSFVMRRIDRSGRRSPVTPIAAISRARASGYPRIAFDRDELVFAWIDHEAGQSSVRTAVAAMSSVSGRP
jgi:hypothetical protein